jgi:hypothetical protein
MVSLLSVLVADLAFAAEVTDLPPALRGDVVIGYGADLFRGPLVEQGERVGGSRRDVHNLDLSLAFAPIGGLAVTAGAQIAPSIRYRFATDGKAMVDDPVADSGSYLGGPALDAPPTFSGGGLVGLWLGVAAGPYGRAVKRDDPFSWRFDLGFRLPDSDKTFWDATDGRGAAPGGSAYRLRGAFAVEEGFAEPYLRATFQHEGRAVVDVVDDAGVVWATDQTIRPPTTFDVVVGTELVAEENTETGLRFAFDWFGSLGWRSASQVPSGVFLPSVLDRSRSALVFQSESLVAGAGLGVIVHPVKYVGVRLAGDFRAWTPYRVEHVYDVVQGAGSHSVGVQATVVGRLR